MLPLLLLFTVSLLPVIVAAAPGTARVTIMEIEGADHVSPLSGDTVTTVGVVTAVASNGFYLQDPVGDGDHATSDAVFVFTGSRTGLVAGDAVEITGPVLEYLSGGDPDNLTVTEIYKPSVLTLSSGNDLPTPIVIGAGGRQPPTETIDDDELSSFDPGHDGIDFYESLEGMLVLLGDAAVVSATNFWGETWLVVDRGADATGMNDRGGITIGAADFNPERIQIDDTLVYGATRGLQLGDLIGDVAGVVSYRFGNFEVLPTSVLEVLANQPPLEVTALEGDATHLTVASFNVQGLHPGRSTQVAGIARIIVDHLGAPDVIGLQEIQDSSGTTSDGNVSADESYRSLSEAIQEVGGPLYDFRDVAPRNGADGGVPGGNIRVGFIFNPARVGFVDRGTPSATEEVRIIDSGTGPQLSLSPGRVDPTNDVWSRSRKPLAGEFEFYGERFFIVVNHFTSRYASSPLFGAVQPSVVGGEDKRQAQAWVVRRFVDDIVALDADARVVVLGDFNDFQFAPAMRTLETGVIVPLINLSHRLPGNDRYTYVFEGNSQALDHVFVTPVLAADAHYDVVHVAAEQAEAASDHDPVVARLNFGPPTLAADPAVALNAGYPNPFVSETTITYSTGAHGHVRLHVYDVSGRLVARLVDDTRARGQHEAWWDGTDGRGSPVASGVYFARLESGGVQRGRKLVIRR